MNPKETRPSGNADENIAELIETLHDTEQRLEELTFGEVDSVANREGRTFMLRRAQDQLRHNEAAKQAAILNALPAHIALLDTQGRIISVNEAWLRLGSPNVLHGPGYGIGPNYLEICDSARGDDASEAHQVAAGIRSVLGGEVKSFSIEYPCHSPTEQRWFLLTVTPMADDHPNGAVVMHLDITERKRAEVDARTLSHTMEQSPASIVITDPAGTIEYVNPHYERVTGYTRAEVVGRNPRILKSGKNAPEVYEQLWAAISVGGEWRGELCNRRKNGEMFWEFAAISGVKSENGQIEHYIAVKEDITERKRAEQAQSRLVAIIEATPDMVATSDLSGHVLYYNPAGLRMLGFEPGLDPSTVHIIDTHPQWAAKLVVETGIPHAIEHGTWRGETALLGRDGREIPISHVIIAHKGSDGSVEYLSTIARDITRIREQEARLQSEVAERRQAEEEVRALNEGLENKVIERTRELQIINTELESFAYSVSHDLRAPLVVVRSFAAALLKTSGAALDENGLKYLERIESAARRMERLIDDLLGLARIVRAPLARCVLDLSALALEVMAGAREGDPGRQCTFKVQPGMRALGDESLLRIVLTNLVANSWKFSAGRDEVFIEVGEDAPMDGQASFFVRDRGAGFDPAHSEKLFDTFQRLHSQEEFPGTGIGLAIVRRVIERHGGRVSGEGKVGGGATFRFSLPGPAEGPRSTAAGSAGRA